jgi:hypothetical protein
MKRWSLLTAGLAVAASGLVCAASLSPAVASPEPGAGEHLRVVSGPSPFAGGCPRAALDETHIAGDEIEPAIAVNPAHPRNLIGTWQQDLGMLARSDLIGWSPDGGKTWRRSQIPGLTACTGGTADAATDPWISVGPDGTAYFLGIQLNLRGDLVNPATAIVASHSRDGGRTWTRPVTVAPFKPVKDTDAIMANPTRAGHAYAVWANWDHTYSFQFPSSVMFSRTTDGGATWSRPVTVDLPGPGFVDQAPRLVVLPNGTLMIAYTQGDLAAGIGRLYATRSLNEGRTWRPAVLAGSQPIQTFFDPETGNVYPQTGFPSAAGGADGTVYVVTERDSSVTSGAIAVARSRDGGRTWTSSMVTGVTAFAFFPSIAVDSRGTAGVTWYDLRNDRPGDAALTADAWFAYSDDRGRTWRQRHLAGPFDLRAPPFGDNGHQLGEYQGLAALPDHGFGALFAAPAPLAKDGPTDIFFARIRPKCTIQTRAAGSAPASAASNRA